MALVFAGVLVVFFMIIGCSRLIAAGQFELDGRRAGLIFRTRGRRR
jgi:hypothetical protein